jgi:hypothetical protein
MKLKKTYALELFYLDIAIALFFFNLGMMFMVAIA